MAPRGEIKAGDRQVFSDDPVVDWITCPRPLSLVALEFPLLQGPFLHLFICQVLLEHGLNFILMHSSRRITANADVFRFCTKMTHKH